MKRTLCATFRQRARVVLVCCSIALGTQGGDAQQDHKTWRDYGGGPDSSHFVALDQINKSNVSQLEVAWIYPTGDNRSYIFNPIVVDNVMYVLARNSSLVALDAATGKEIWIHENLPGLTSRGIAYWESKDRKDRRLIFTMNNYLQEIDARTGKSILSSAAMGWSTSDKASGRDPNTIVRIQPDSPGRVFENLIMLGSSTGEAYLSPPGRYPRLRRRDGQAGLDLSHDSASWRVRLRHVAERRVEVRRAAPTRGARSQSTRNAASRTSRPAPRPTITTAPIGSGANLFANCLLALDARTGKRLWHFQMVHHDLWDYDTTAAPQLITVRHEGKPIDVVAQSTKQGFLYRLRSRDGETSVADRGTAGAEERYAGRAGVADAAVPDCSAPFARQNMTADDVNPYILTAEERAAWKDRISKMRNEGLFTPPGLG